MKRLISLSALAASLAGGLSIVYAQTEVEGVDVNFKGEIIETGCTVKETNQTVTVDLGKVFASEMKDKKDQVFGKKDFKVNLECPTTTEDEGNTTVARLLFNTTQGNTTDGDFALNKGSADRPAATGLAVRLFDTMANPEEIIKAGVKTSDYMLGPGDNTIDLKAAYVTTAEEVTTGPANATISLTIDHN